MQARLSLLSVQALVLVGYLSASVLELYLSDERYFMPLPCCTFHFVLLLFDVGEPLLVVAGSLSGTVSIYRINKFISDDMKFPKRVQTFSGVFIPTTDSATTVAVNRKLI